MNTPIVLSAFGTTTRAMKTYSFINEVFKERFSDHPIYWTFSSRIVKDRSNEHQHTNMQHPHQVLERLKAEGHEWAVVQSLHFMCGHEFYRLIDEVQACDIRTAIGMPLLNEPKDYQAIADALIRVFPRIGEEAVVLVGHGTDHPSWCSYVALNQIIRERLTSGIYVGVVEEGYPKMSSVIREVKDAGYRQVRLIPFMLVAGMHFEEDLSGNEDSWKMAFEREGIDVALESQGLGFHREIVDLYCRHIEDALDIIPYRSK